MGCLGSGPPTYAPNPERKERHPQTSQLEREEEYAKCVKASLYRQSIQWEDYLGLSCNSIQLQGFVGGCPPHLRPLPVCDSQRGRQSWSEGDVRTAVVQFLLVTPLTQAPEARPSFPLFSSSLLPTGPIGRAQSGTSHTGGV